MTDAAGQPAPKKLKKKRKPEALAEWPFWLPMMVFMIVLFAGSFQEGWGPWSYVVRTLLVGGVLVWVYPKLKVDIQWTHTGLGVIVGVLGLVQWVGMDKLLQAVRNQFDDDWAGSFFWELLVSGVRPEDGIDYVQTIAEPAGWGVFLAFAVIRFLGPVLVVPLMEEVFWRDWLWRKFIAPNNWRLAKLGEPELIGWLGTSLAFSLVHPQRLVSVVWALMVAWLLIRTKSLGAVIIAHAVTNLLLGVYVLVAVFAFGYTSEWYFW